MLFAYKTTLPLLNLEKGNYHSQDFNHQIGELAQQLKVLAAKHDSLS